MFMIPEKSGVGFFDAFRVRDGDCARTTGGGERHEGHRILQLCARRASLQIGAEKFVK